MYPNQPPQAPVQPPAPTPSPGPYQNPTPSSSPLPVDYLNQIAPQAPKKQLFTFGLKQIIVIGAVLVVLVIMLAVIVNNVASSSKSPLEHLSARLTATQAVANSAQVNLKSSELRSLNSNLKLYLTNTNRDIGDPLLSAGVNTAKLDKNIVTAESTAALSIRLEDARLNAVYDQTYAREMAYQLGQTMTLMEQINSSTSNAKLKAFLRSAYTSLKPTQESFANFQATN
ncbi:MAG TPA: hypothetical protein VIM37_02485 [Candidatus Microsaccharimonas sp.]|jgi:predicted outer membrane protein